MTQSHSSLPVLVVKGVLAGILYVLGSILFGMIGGAFHLGFPSLSPPGVDPQASFRAFLLACPLIGLALVPLALRTAGSRLIRGLALFLLAFISLGPTAVIEMKMFTTFLAHGGALTVVASTFLPTLLCGLGLSYLLKLEPAEPSPNGKIRSLFAAHSPASWAGRFVLAFVGFVAVFFLFGMMVAPFVVPVYRAGGFGPTLPPISPFLPFEFVRSALFLVACFPILLLWKASRGWLIFSLGLALWVLNGLFGLLQSLGFPPVLRIAHSLEIGADSFVYAAVLVFLLVPRPRQNSVPMQAHPAPMFPS
jgi:hypothetical protein